MANRFPHSTIENLRGNVNTRLQKLHQSNWQGAVFAAAGLERLAIQDLVKIQLDWMLPAPAQGAIVIVCRKNDTKITDACAAFNDFDSQVCTQVEKDFLRILMGGCSTPIAAYAQIINQEIHFKGNILSTDGAKKISVELTGPAENFSTMGQSAAAIIIEKGGKKILNSFNSKIVVNG